MGIQETGPRGGVNLCRIHLALRTTFLRHGQNIFQSVTEQNKTCCCEVKKTTPIFSAPVFLLSLYFFLSPPILLRVFDEVLFLGTMNTLPTMPKQLLLKADHTDFSLGVVVAALHTRQEVVCRVHSRAPPLSKCGLRPWNLAQIVWARLGLL